MVFAEVTCHLTGSTQRMTRYVSSAVFIRFKTDGTILLDLHGLNETVDQSAGDIPYCTADVSTVHVPLGGIVKIYSVPVTWR